MRSYGAWKPVSSNLATSSPDDAPADVLSWANRYRRIDGQPFSLSRYEPLRALYEDDHRHICVIKPAQRGVSEYAVNLTCFALEYGAAAWATSKNGLNIGYLFPTQQALSDFSKERISNLRQEHPHLQKMFGNTDLFGGVTFKQVGNSFLYMRGAASESQLLSFAADVLILDEFDRMDGRAVALARRRLNASVVRREIDISTPTVPGRGIHALYAQSDRQVYEQRCPYCGRWVRCDFHRDVRVDGVDFGVWKDFGPARIRKGTVCLSCPACRHDYDDADRLAPGRWVAEEPGITSLRGYHIPALPFPTTDLTNLCVGAVATDPGEATEFWRSDLGIPYDAAGSRVTAAMLVQCAADLPGGHVPTVGAWRDVTMGVDVGARFHYRVSGTHAPTKRRIVLALGTAATWDDLTQLMARFRVRRCVIDALPELHGCVEWAGGRRGRALRAFYAAGTADAKQLAVPDDKAGTVRINRTMAMDGVYNALAEGAELWPLPFALDRDIVAHLTAPVRITVTGATGEPVPTWAHTQPDHFYHACVYDRVALHTLALYRLDHRTPVFTQGVARGWVPG